LNDQITNTWTYSCTYNPSTGGSSSVLLSHDYLGYNFANDNDLHGVAAASGFQPPLPGGTMIGIVAIGFNTTGNGLATPAVAVPHRP
jgi:hypothetical protein